MVHANTRILTRLSHSSLVVLKEQLGFFSGSRASRTLFAMCSVRIIAKSSFLQACFRRGL
ncbi:hypothetical protein HanRHA438_Chr17g0821761 [Helianthus annuus]|nr:hypothetical protein HanRHA438_Chr17g0821761 [Helianthus annuus]